MEDFGVIQLCDLPTTGNLEGEEGSSSVTSCQPSPINDEVKQFSECAPQKA